MGKKLWEFTLDDGNHTVELEHGYFSGKRKITVDGAPVVRISRNINDAGSLHAFRVSSVPCQVLIEPRFPFPGTTFKYSLYVDGKPVNGEKVRRIEGIRQMRNSFGGLNMYLWALGITLIGVLIPLGMLVGAWFMALDGDWLGYGAAAMFVLMASGTLYFVGPVVPHFWRDAFSPPTRVTGRVSRKWITEEKSSTQYGEVKSKEFHIAIDGRSFDVSRRVYDWLSQGNEVVVHYWSRTETVAKVEKF